MEGTDTHLSSSCSCADPESFIREFCFLGFFFLLMSGGRIKMPLLAGHHRPASETPFEMAFLWRADDGSTLIAGLVAL